MFNKFLVAFCLFLMADVGFGETNYTSIYEAFKKLEGRWHGSSTKGWQNRETFRVIARGSAILSTSEFIDSPEEAMASVIMLDGNTLLLTHYCEAGNQPVLRATSVEQNGKKVTFEFYGGTNLPTRDRGHMDKVVWSFEDPDHFSSQWSWYANGKQTVFETIRYERSKE